MPQKHRTSSKPTISKRNIFFPICPLAGGEQLKEKRSNKKPLKANLMQSIHLITHVGEDGLLTVQMPPEIKGMELDVMVVFSTDIEGRTVPS